MIQFEVKKSVLKIGKHQGKTMYVARQVSHARLSADAVEERIERMTSLSRSDVRAAILALSLIIEEEIRTGRAVDLRELGTFKIVSTGRYQTEAKQVSAQTLRVPHVRFYPKKSMRLAARAVGLEILPADPAGKKKSAGGASPQGKPGSEGSSQGGHSGGPSSGDGHLGI